MTAKITDLSILIWHGATMWPKFAHEVQIGAGTFTGVRSTGWNGQNHPGWFDMGQPFPFDQGWGELHNHMWVGHLHVGTHIVAPIYIIPEGTTADKISLESEYGTGVVVDMRHKKKWDTITAEDLEQATPKIEPGDIVVVNTGWHTWLRPDKAYEYYNYYPGLVPSAAQWLIDKKVKALAGTWPVPDHSLSFAPLQQNMPWVYNDYKRETGVEPGEGLGGFEQCLEMLLRSGITCIMNAGGEIDKVTGQRLTLAAWPFRMEETDAAMVRLVAIQE